MSINCFCCDFLATAKSDAQVAEDRCRCRRDLGRRLGQVPLRLAVANAITACSMDKVKAPERKSNTK